MFWVHEFIIGLKNCRGRGGGLLPVFVRKKTQSEIILTATICCLKPNEYDLQTKITNFPNNWYTNRVSFFLTIRLMVDSSVMQNIFNDFHNKALPF